MTNYKPGDVVLVEFIFTTRDGSKCRPALVISSETYNKSRQELIVVAITTNIERKLFAETILKNWKEAGLQYHSAITAIVQTIKKDMVKHKIGELSQDDLKTVDTNLKRALGFK